VLTAEPQLHAVVNCVGVSAASPIENTSLEEWRGVLAINLDGAFLATKHGIRAMRETGGVIVHVGSASGIRPAPGAAAYSTSKAALRMLVRTAAKECRQAAVPIRVNLVSPAGVRTAMWRTMPFFQHLVREHGSEDAAFGAMTKAGGGVFVEPEAIARVVCFLLTDSARHITGVELPVDDGYVL
jgi:NAD(P)-dependent dehydrogenase (short-subunit alcohol dehydrogenase family)